MVLVETSSAARRVVEGRGAGTGARAYGWRTNEKINSVRTRASLLIVGSVASAPSSSLFCIHTHTHIQTLIHVGIADFYTNVELIHEMEVHLTTSMGVEERGVVNFYSRR